MYEVIGIKFDSSNHIYYFSVNHIKLHKQDKVIVENEGSVDYGECVTNIIKESKDNLVFPLKKVLRKATKEDFSVYFKNKEKAESALEYAKNMVNKLALNMHLISSTYTFDQTQLYFNFTAEERVDFRELAKKLAQKYKTRIELRQIGVRDKAKLVGGIGPCGLFLCCNTFLTDFNSVSINMAKNQFLALNPSKINGVCGRLLCCLNYEDELYSELKVGLPNVGERIDTPSGYGKVVSVDIFNRTYKVDVDKTIIEMSA